MRENRTYGSEGGAAVNRRPYPYQSSKSRAPKAHVVYSEIKKGAPDVRGAFSLITND
jgi:hypothetical protein